MTLGEIRTLRLLLSGPVTWTGEIPDDFEDMLSDLAIAGMIDISDCGPGIQIDITHAGLSALGISVH